LALSGQPEISAVENSYYLSIYYGAFSAQTYGQIAQAYAQMPRNPLGENCPIISVESKSAAQGYARSYSRVVGSPNIVRDTHSIAHFAQWLARLEKSVSWADRRSLEIMPGFSL